MYKQLYKNLIDFAKNENRIKGANKYYESHHIVPDFLFKNRKRSGPPGHIDGDPNSAENLVLLTFSEHLMAHYYLYEIYKGTHYEYSAGSALQFFFVKACGNHMRQIQLNEVDEQFLKEMSYLRQLGIDSISKAKEAFGFDPKITFEEGLRRTIAYFGNEK
jgi:nucleoside-diphosphate-sugar epimerase